MYGDHLLSSRQYKDALVVYATARPPHMYVVKPPRDYRGGDGIGDVR